MKSSNMEIHLFVFTITLLFAVCNGRQNCSGGSDDESCKNRFVRQTAGGCVLPEQPSNGRYLLGGCDPPACHPKAGSRVEFAMLNYSCASGFVLSGAQIVYCVQQWMSPFPSCEGSSQTSSPRCLPFSGSSHVISCFLNNKEVRCDQPLLPLTKAVVRCPNFSEAQSHLERSEITCDSKGFWSHRLMTCIPKCGEFNTNMSTGVSDIGKPRNLPWYAAIMKKDSNGSWKFACSATIISARTLVSAAQCVWKESDQRVLSADNFGVWVGKYEHGPKEAKTQYTQEFLVERIYIPESFRGLARRYAADISLFILKSDIRWNELIRPICVDFNDQFSPYFVPGKIGLIGSWGEPVNDTYRQRIVSLPMVEYEKCLNNIPVDYHSYLTNDKFCAGVLKSKTVCVGDLGVGYANQFRDGKWYLTGIASVGVTPSEGEECEVNYYKSFTRVSLYRDFINKNLVHIANDTEEHTTSTPVILCKEDEFECASSECVNESYLCDGEKHCPDGSDETNEACHQMRCPEISFQCGYGACIDKKLICNGVNDCEDGSDEKATLCSKLTSCSYPPSSGCKLPNQPKNGYYTFFGCKQNIQLQPDSIVPVGVLLNFSCNPGFVLSGPSLLACYDEWSSQPPLCNPVLCEPLKNPSRDIQCIFGREDVDCLTKPVKAGTRASVKCTANYESIPGLQSYDMICEASGRWNRELQSCIPKCGIPNPRGVTFIAFSGPSKLAEFPWHIGLYRTLDDGRIIPSCGGTIVSSRVVVSAAHCFWRFGEPFVKYKIVAGKYYYEWENKTKHVQHLEIQDVILPRDYNGPGRNHANDIALIILKYSIQITEAVRPVCVDYERNYLNYFSPVGTVGNVTGWGMNENNTYSEVLRVANLPYVDNEECERNTPLHFHSYLTSDKFCAGNINRTSVCPGDSGGGYTVIFRDRRYYLVGIVSAGPSDTCGIFPYSVFTNVFHHVDFIREYVYKYV